jgi:hypothetical protein
VGVACAVGPAVVEVWARYGRLVLDVQHLGRGASGCYTIAESHEVALVVSSTGLPNDGAFALVRGSTLNFTASMRGEVSFGGETVSLRTLVREGRATVCGSTYSVSLRPGARCRVEHDAVTFFVNVVPPAEPLRLEFQSSRRLWVSTLIAFLLFASVLVPAYCARPRTARSDVALDERPAEHAVAAFAGHAAPDDLDALADSSADSSFAGSGAGNGAGDGDTDGSGDGDGDGDTEAGRWVSLDNPVLCQARDILAVEATHETHVSLLTPVGPCEVPEPGGIPQMARNFDPDRMILDAGIVPRDPPSRKTPSVIRRLNTALPPRFVDGSSPDPRAAARSS